MESVSDSSRYFVIKIKNPNDGRSAFIGIGFEDRSDSFDLNVALQDHFKRVSQEQASSQDQEDENAPKIDLSLKEGQTIKVNLNIGRKSGTARPKPKTAGSSMGVLLPPPPSCSKPAAGPPTFPSSVFSAAKPADDQDILSFDSPRKPKNVLDEFDNLKLGASGSNDDWSNFASYKLDDKSDGAFDSSKFDKFDSSKLDDNPELDKSTSPAASTDQTSSSANWATFF